MHLRWKDGISDPLRVRLGQQTDTEMCVSSDTEMCVSSDTEMCVSSDTEMCVSSDTEMCVSSDTEMCVSSDTVMAYQRYICKYLMMNRKDVSQSR